MAKAGIGDRVKFLDTTGGGIVTRIIDHNTVMVLIEDGFEVPTLLRDIIVEKVSSLAASQAESISPAPLKRKFSIKDELAGVYLAFVIKPGSKISADCDLYIVNHTPHDILYNLLAGEEGQYKGFDYGSAAPESTALIQASPEDNNIRLLNGLVQILYHPFRKGTALNPLSTRFRIKALRLLDENNFSMNAFFESPALLVYLGYEGEIVTLKPVPTPKPARNLSEKLIESYRVAEGEAVIDLHLEALRADVQHMSAAEALHIQLGHFETVIDAAIKCGYHKLIFIHGVGNGILKSEIRKKLSDLEGVIHYDAPMYEYGVGATEVRLP